MAPPFKKRRLSSTSPSILPSRTTLSVSEPTPGFAHSIEHLEHPRPTTSRTTPVRQHVQEIHLQIQEHVAMAQYDHYHSEHRRQAGTVTQLSVITTVDAAGSTILSTVTNFLPTVTVSTPATSSPSTTPSTSTANTSDGFIGSSAGSETSNTNSTASTSTHSATKHTGTGSPTLSGGNNNGTATHHATGATGNHHTSTKKSTSLATLTNGNVHTLSPSDKPYVTTFADGEKFTVCDRQGDCRIPKKTNSPKTTSSQSFSASSSQPVALTTTFVPGAHTGHGSASSPSETTSPSSNNDNNTPPAATIAGGVVGGAAGIAVIVLIALVLLRWWKRRSQQGHHALPPGSAMSMSSPDDDRTMSSRGPGMAERAGLTPLVNAVPALFRHQNRSREEPPPPISTERGFTRVSGRKLPSAFSEGMSSPGGSGGLASPGPPPTMPLTSPEYNISQERNLSSTSFYRDSQGFYGGQGGSAAVAGAGAALLHELPDSPSPDRGSPSPEGDIALSPGPQRTPTVHQGGPYIMEPSRSVPSTPVTGPGYVPGAMGVARSGTPTGSSKFAEDV